MLTQQLTMLRECRDTGLLITAPDCDRILTLFSTVGSLTSQVVSVTQDVGILAIQTSHQLLYYWCGAVGVDQVKAKRTVMLFVCFAKAAVTRTEEIHR